MNDRETPGKLIHGAPLIVEDLSLDGMMGSVYVDGNIAHYVIVHKDGECIRVEVNDEQWRMLMASKGPDGRAKYEGIINERI